MGYPPYPFKRALFFVKPTGSVKVIISEKVREVNCSLGAKSRARGATHMSHSVHYLASSPVLVSVDFGRFNMSDSEQTGLPRSSMRFWVMP